MRISDWSSDVCSSDLSCLLPTLSHLSVNTSPVSRLRHWCSSEYLRISPLHSEFHSPLLDSSDAVLKAIPGLSPGLSPLTCKAAYVRFRSEEHTSELQSLMRISYAVFCLKKKKK